MQYEINKEKELILLVQVYSFSKFGYFRSSRSFVVSLCFLVFSVGFLVSFIFIYLFGVLRHFQHCTGHIPTGRWKGRGNQYIQFIRALYCKMPTNGKQLPAFPLEAVRGLNPGLRGGRRECYHSATVALIFGVNIHIYSFAA